MEAIGRRKKTFAILTWLSVSFNALIFASSLWRPLVLPWLLLPISILASGSMLVFWFGESQKLKAAQLIAENHILQICIASIDEGTNSSKTKRIMACISYFGILLDTKLIKFNQDGVFLKTVEIGRNFISLSYGTEYWVKRTRLLHATLSRDELEDLLERFREETGIAPAVLS